MSDNGNFGITVFNITNNHIHGINTIHLLTTWRIGILTTGSSFGVAITPRSATSKMLITGTLVAQSQKFYPQYNIGVHVMKYTGSGRCYTGATADAASNRFEVTLLLK